jgi:hypothetical protein
MRLNRLQEKLPEAIINWYVNSGLHSAIKSIGSRREGLTLVVRLDKTIHTWRYDEGVTLADGRTKPLADWELEVVTKRSAVIEAVIYAPTMGEVDAQKT